MANLAADIKALAEEFRACQKTLLALGDENRQHLILTILGSGDCNGLRVGAIAEKTNLSRPAVYHHIRILKEAGLVKMRQEGTKHFYYFDGNTQSINRLLQMLSHASAIMERLPDKSEQSNTV